MERIGTSRKETGRLIAAAAALLGAAAFAALLRTGSQLMQGRVRHHDVAVVEIVLAALLCAVAAWAGLAGRRRAPAAAAMVLAIWRFAQTAAPYLLYVTPLPRFVRLLAGSLAVLAWTKSRRAGPAAA